MSLTAIYVFFTLALFLSGHSVSGEGTSSALAAKQGEETDLDKAVLTLKRYIKCESGKTKECFSLLSRNTLSNWASQGVKTEDQYAEVKNSEESSFGEFKISKVKQLGEWITIKTKIKRRGEAVGIANIDFYLVKENGQ